MDLNEFQLMGYIKIVEGDNESFYEYPYIDAWYFEELYTRLKEKENSELQSSVQIFSQIRNYNEDTDQEFQISSNVPEIPPLVCTNIQLERDDDPEDGDNYKINRGLILTDKIYGFNFLNYFENSDVFPYEIDNSIQFGIVLKEKLGIIPTRTTLDYTKDTRNIFSQNILSLPKTIFYEYASLLDLMDKTSAVDRATIQELTEKLFTTADSNCFKIEVDGCNWEAGLPIEGTIARDMQYSDYSENDYIEYKIKEGDTEEENYLRPHLKVDNDILVDLKPENYNDTASSYIWSFCESYVPSEIPLQDAVSISGENIEFYNIKNKSIWRYNWKATLKARNVPDYNWDSDSFNSQEYLNGTYYLTLEYYNSSDSGVIIDEKAPTSISENIALWEGTHGINIEIDLGIYLNDYWWNLSRRESLKPEGTIEFVWNYPVRRPMNTATEQITGLKDRSLGRKIYTNYHKQAVESVYKLFLNRFKCTREILTEGLDLFSILQDNLKHFTQEDIMSLEFLEFLKRDLGKPGFFTTVEDNEQTYAIRYSLDKELTNRLNEYKEITSGTEVPKISYYVWPIPEQEIS
ncbi:MAG: hypothetical protein GF364_02890 [Candidatus Lokiarchaeota archaeon]|nr:hypothetical protein [Candidatus Lokiarchaeota archaeon]